MARRRSKNNPAPAMANVNVAGSGTHRNRVNVRRRSIAQYIQPDIINGWQIHALAIGVDRPGQAETGAAGRPVVQRADAGQILARKIGRGQGGIHRQKRIPGSVSRKQAVHRRCQCRV